MPVASPSFTTSRDETATAVSSSPASSFHEDSPRRRFPLALVLGSFLLAALLVALLYAWRGQRTNEVADANTNAAPSPLTTPGAQTETTPATPGAQTEATPAPPTATPGSSPSPSATVEPAGTTEKERAALRATVDSWLASHNSRNLSQLTNFYMPRVAPFYRAQNTSRAAVRAEKARLFEEPAMSIKRTSDPEIIFATNGRVATTLFRKSYSRGGTARPESGEVLQEIVWQKTNRGWKIISERDLRVLR